MTAIEQNDPFKGPLANGTSYYGLGGDSSIIQHVHLMWDASLVATITFESSDFKEVSLTSTTTGEWIQENPVPTYLAITGGSNVALTITVPGGAAGGASIHIGNLGSRRMRLKVVTTTPGFLRVGAAGKE